VTDEPVPGYRHTQKGPWPLLLFPLGVGCLVAAGLLWDVRIAPAALGATGVAMLLASACFAQLTVADAGDHLRIAFGPLPLFRKRICYADIRSVEPGRTLLSDGWGIHYSVRGGWVWNLWGRQCVVIRHTATTRVGTDDADNLARFLRSKLAPVPEPVA
jgi:hypothetical protein